MASLNNANDWTGALRRMFTLRGAVYPEQTDLIQPVVDLSADKCEPFGIARRVIVRRTVTVATATQDTSGFAVVAGQRAIVRELWVSRSDGLTTNCAVTWGRCAVAGIVTDANQFQQVVSDDAIRAAGTSGQPLSLLGNGATYSIVDNAYTLHLGPSLYVPNLQVNITDRNKAAAFNGFRVFLANNTAGNVEFRYFAVVDLFVDE